MAKDFARKFYKSDKWQKARETRLKMDNYLCVRCGEPAEEVHHRTYLRLDNINDAGVTLNVKKLESLCRDCHFKEHETREGKYVFYPTPETESGYAFDENGELVQVARVNIISGCIGSGKTTYVREHMERGDLVVDMDNIFNAISFQPIHDHPANLLGTAVDIAECLYKAIEQNKVQCKNIWVTTTLKEYKLTNLINRLNARHIPQPSDRAACVARVMADPAREETREQDLKLIDEWFGNVNVTRA